jgi:hypothetical protein
MPESHVFGLRVRFYGAGEASSVLVSPFGSMG